MNVTRRNSFCLIGTLGRMPNHSSCVLKARTVFFSGQTQNYLCLTTTISVIVVVQICVSVVSSLYNQLSGS